MKIKNISTLALIVGLAAPIAANAVNSEDVKTWLKANQAATAEFKDGDVIGFAEREKIRAFVPPGYDKEMFFEGMKVVVKDPTDMPPAKVYSDASSAHQSKVSITPAGGLAGYVAGQPFSAESIKVDDPTAGSKIAWNFNFRWQNQGLSVDNVGWVWVRRGGDHENSALRKDPKFGKYVGGGGSFNRVLWAWYRRVYFNHRADLPDQDYKLKGSMSRDTEFRELTSFYDPFDIAGTAFMIIRHLDETKADDSWAYVPSTRRVRRISVEVKTDSLLGTDLTLEDFYMFAGRVPDHKWVYLGDAKVLTPARSRSDETYYTGPMGIIPDDNWELRDSYVVADYPKDPAHPYSVKYMLIDKQTNMGSYALNFDRSGELWKIIQQSKVWSEDDQAGPRRDMPVKGGINIPLYQSINIIDVQNDRGTLVPVWGVYYPVNKASKIKRMMDVNRLTEGS